MKVDFKQLGFIHPTLRQILTRIDMIPGTEQTITSLYRIDHTGVHSTLPLRGVDLRCRVEEIGEEIAAIINELWEYDPDRPEMKCAMVHGEGGNMHLHLQVHPTTVKRSR